MKRKKPMTKKLLLNGAFNKPQPMKQEPKNIMKVMGQPVLTPNYKEKMGLKATEQFFEEIMTVCETALHDEFGFGEKRNKRFRKAFEKAVVEIKFRK